MTFAVAKGGLAALTSKGASSFGDFAISSLHGPVEYLLVFFRLAGRPAGRGCAYDLPHLKRRQIKLANGRRCEIWGNMEKSPKAILNLNPLAYNSSCIL